MRINFYPEKKETIKKDACIYVDKLFAHHGLTFGLIKDNVVFDDEIEIKYPLYVLRGVLDDQGFKYYLTDGSVLEFVLSDNVIKIKYNGVVIFEREYLSKYDQFKKEHNGPYNKITVKYRDDNIAPNMQWFMDDGKYYVYWDRIEHLTDPLIINYILSSKYLDSVTNKLISEGYKVEETLIYD